MRGAVLAFILLAALFSVVGCVSDASNPPTPIPAPTSAVTAERAAVVDLIESYNRQHPIALAEGDPDKIKPFFDTSGPSWLGRQAAIIANRTDPQPYRARYLGMQASDFRLENTNLAVIVTAEVWDVWRLVDGVETDVQRNVITENLYTVRRENNGPWVIYSIDQQVRR